MTAKEFIIKEFGEEWAEPHFNWGTGDVIDAMEKYSLVLRQPDVIKSVCQCRKDLPNGNVELCDKCYPTDKA